MGRIKSIHLTDRQRRLAWLPTFYFWYAFLLDLLKHIGLVLQLSLNSFAFFPLSERLRQLRLWCQFYGLSHFNFVLRQLNYRLIRNSFSALPRSLACHALFGPFGGFEFLMSLQELVYLFFFLRCLLFLLRLCKTALELFFAHLFVLFNVF